MKFELLKLRAKNFVLYEDLNIDFQTLEGNLIFIVGKNLDISGTDSNGTGKTLIGDLITDLLFDKTIRGHSQQSFIGKFDKWCFSSLFVRESLSGEVYSIEKYRKHPKHGDKLFFKKGPKSKGSDLTKKTKALTYDIIWKTLGLNWHTFKNRNYFGQDDMGRFLRVTDAKKAEIIIDIQQLHSFEEARKLAHIQLRSSKSIVESKTVSLEHLEEKFVLAKKFYVDQKKSLKNQLDEERVMIFGLEKEISEKESKIKNVDYLKKQILVCEDEIKRIKGDLVKAVDIKAELSEITSDLSDIKIKISFETEARKKLTDKISGLKKEISDLKNKITVSCEKCGADLDGSRRMSSIRTVNLDLRENKAASEKKKKIIADLTNEKVKLVKAKNDLALSLLEYKSVISDHEELLKKHDDLKTKVVKNDKFLASIEFLKDKILDANKRIKIRAKNNLSAMKKDIDVQREEYASLKKEILRLKKEADKDEFAKAVFYKTIRSLFNSFLSDLNNHSNSLLDSLCDNDIDVQFRSRTERKSKKVVDEINVLISVDGAAPRNFKTYSGGERGRVEFVTQLALFLSSENSFPFLFLDEIFTGVDNSGRERMISLLQEIAEKGNKVFIVSNKVVPTGYGQIIEVVRKDSKSTINY